MTDQAAIQARAVLALKAAGFSVPEIVLAMNVSKATVYRRVIEAYALARANESRSKHAVR